MEKNWYAGLSIPQLLSFNPNLYDENFHENFDKESEGKLVRHYYIIGAYKHHFDPFWAVEPSVFVKINWIFYSI